MSCGNGKSILEQVLAACTTPDKIKIANVESTTKLIEELMSGGSNSLQVIMDFDFTFTRRHLNGETCHSSHGILDNSPLMPESYRKAGLEGVQKYYPIEIDPTLSVEEKIPHMIEWYNATHSNLIAANLTKNDLVEIVKVDKHVYLRDNAIDTLTLLNDATIPTLIFSAGIGNLIELVLQMNDIHFPNIHIISNFVKFDNNPAKVENDQLIIGFQEPMVHMFNKNEETIPKNSTYFQDLAHRNNAILLGDTITDVTMSNGVHNPNAILKIGFLNDKIDERLDLFLQTFDIVLIDDQTMDFMNTLLKFVLKK